MDGKRVGRKRKRRRLMKKGRGRRPAAAEHTQKNMLLEKERKKKITRQFPRPCSRAVAIETSSHCSTNAIYTHLHNAA
jgi:hypothetical protein